MDFSAENYKNILDDLHDGVYMVDRNRQISYWNKAAERITGYKAKEVIGSHCHDNILTHVNEKGENLCVGACPVQASINDGQRREAEVFLHHKDGHRVPVNVRISTLRDKQGYIIGGIELFSDLLSKSIQDERIEELEKLALIDHLTNLANRQYLEREINIRFEEQKRFNSGFNLLFIDIDKFKSINDTFGHAVGDKVLKFVANTLISNSRPFDLFGRWGGDEFIGIIKNISKNDLDHSCTRLKTLIEKSYIINRGESLSITVSLGATLVQKDDTINSIIQRADKLMYESKKAGRNQIRIG